VRALELYDPERDREANLRYGVDTRAGALAYLASVKWGLGEIAQVRGLSEEAIAYALGTGHVPTIVGVYQTEAMLESLYGDAAATRRTAETVLELGQQHKLAVYVAWGQIYSGWAREKLGEREAGTAQLQRGLVALTELGTKGGAVLYPQGLFAEIEAQGQQVEGALARIDEALALAQQTGEHWSDAFLHRVRGEILLKRDPANTAPAEEAFLTAVAIAQQQKARSFELRPAPLVKLYQSTGRAADAHAVLAPALEGFSPTPGFPEIAEAQTLLAELAETDEVKNAVALRQRRLKLQTSYGQALQWSKGYVAEEAKAAFKRAEELAAGTDNDAERFKIYHGQFVASYMRAELKVAQEIAKTVLRGAEIGKRLQEVAIAETILGLTFFMQGAFADARALFEKALGHHNRHAKIPVAIDTEDGAKIHLAYTIWVTGDFARARDLINEAVARAVQIRDPANQCTAYSFKSRFEMLRGDAEGARRAAEKLLEVSQGYNTKLFLVSAVVYGSWARTRLRDLSANAKQFQQALRVYADEGNKIWLPLYQGRLAEVEADCEGIEQALDRIDGALALGAETTEHWSDSLLHRIRGEILLKKDPAYTVRAEEAFRTAIAIAKQQKARSFELLAALALAKLCQKENRAADAQAVLAPALEGFIRTQEWPEIEDARALLEMLSAAVTPQ
jgi:predicted ATPase